MRIETDFVDHPKVQRLARILMASEAEAGWYVLRAWSWLSRFCPTGHIRDSDGTALELACRWKGKDRELLEAMTGAGFLDELPAGEFEAHDWSDHQGKVAATAEKERERKAAYRARSRVSVPSLSRGTTDGTNTGRPAQRDVTGRDVTGRKEETSVEQGSTGPVALEDKLTDDEFSVFEHWRVVLNHPRAKPTPERKRLIGKWLKIYTLFELQAAITGCSRSPYHMGENDRHTKYDDLELILRDAQHIERFLALAPEIAASAKAGAA